MRLLHGLTHTGPGPAGCAVWGRVSHGTPKPSPPRGEPKPGRADGPSRASLHRAAEVVVPDGALPRRGGVQGPARPLRLELQQRQQSEDDQGMSMLQGQPRGHLPKHPGKRPWSWRGDGAARLLGAGTPRPTEGQGELTHSGNPVLVLSLCPSKTPRVRGSAPEAVRGLLAPSPWGRGCSAWPPVRLRAPSAAVSCDRELHDYYFHGLLNAPKNKV